jgi:hypothetical protein
MGTVSTDEPGGSNPNPPAGFDLDNSPEGWRPVIEVNRLDEPGSVVLLVGEYGLDASHIAAWYAAIAALRKAGTSSYHHFHHLLLPQEPDSCAGLDLKLQSLMPSGSAPTVKVSALPSSEVADLERAIATMPERTAASLVGLECIRSANVEIPPAVEVEHWEGGVRAIRTRDELHSAHVAAAIRVLLPIAKERSLLLLVAARLSRTAVAMLSEDVRRLDGVAILSSPRSFHEVAADRIMALARHVQSGEMELSDALSSVDTEFREPKQRALARSQLLFAAQHFAAAWGEVEPFLNFWLEDVHRQSPALFLGLGQTAFAAQRRDAAAKFLEAALLVKPTTFEELRTAYRLADSLDDERSAESVCTLMQSIFPTDEATLRLSRHRALEKWDYATAEDISTKLGETSEAMLWNTLARTELKIDKLLADPDAKTSRARILACAAREAFRRGDLNQADHWAGLIAVSAPEYALAIEIRLQIFRDVLLSKKRLEDGDVDDFVPLVEAVASLPENARLRVRFEDVLEEELPESTAMQLLLAVTWKTLPVVLSRANQAPRWLFDEAKSAEDFLTEDLAYLKEAAEALEPPIVAVGRGTLPERLRGGANRERLRRLMRASQMMPVEADDDTTPPLLLSVVEKIARAAHDPSADVLIAELLINRQARAGGLQRARNLAEETLRVLPTTQPEYRQWRLALAWYAVGEGFSVTGNPMAGLRHVALALVVLKNQVLEAEPVCYLLRLFTKCLRDIGLPQFAVQSIGLERKLRQHIGATELLYQLEQVELSIEIKSLPTASPHRIMQFLKRSLRLWRDLPEAAEMLPTLSLVVSFMRMARWAGVQVPETLRDEVIEALSCEHGPNASLLSATARGEVTRSQLLAFIRAFDGAVRADDLATQAGPLRLVARDALDQAVREDEPDLFLTAASIFSQPVLSASVAVEPSGERDFDAARLRQWALAMAGDAATDPAVLRDIYELLTNVGQPSTLSISDACSTTTQELRTVIAEDEAILLLAEGPDDRLRLCLVHPAPLTQLLRLDSSTWSAHELAKWHERFPGGFRSTESISGKGWTIDELRNRMNGLCLPLTTIAKYVTLVPTADLFDFSFGLCDIGQLCVDDSGSEVEPQLVRWAAGGEFLGRAARLSIAPSAAWLVHSRKNKPRVLSQWRAWFGSPLATDQAIVALHKYVASSLPSRNVAVVTNDAPDGLAESALAIIGSHGQRDTSGQFRAISDGRANFSPAEVGRYLRGCGCVVLSVCHGGGSSVATSTNEIRGMVAALLGVGVRAVIAPAWPISVETAAYWLPVFLDLMKSGETVTEACYRAARIVEKHVSDAAAWAAFQVYGDGLYIPPQV